MPYTRTKIKYACLGGAADPVNLSGSCHLLTIHRGKRKSIIMVDCGMVHANFQKVIEENMEILLYLPPETLKQINACIITHTHADHVARLPLLVQQGLNCPVLCTAPSATLMPAALYDSAHIQQSEKKYRERIRRRQQSVAAANGNVKYRRKDQPKFCHLSDNRSVLFTRDDVDLTIKLIKNGGSGYFEWQRVDKDIYLKFYPAGHVLGGAIAVIRIDNAKSDKQPYYVAFSGDLGSDEKLFLSPAVPPQEPIDLWVVESTYGGLEHPSKESELDRMVELILQADRHGMKILNANFALEKSQEMIFLLTHLAHEGVIPRIPVFLDAPLARSFTSAYAKYWQSDIFIGQNHLPFNPFDLENNPYIQVVEDSEGSNELAERKGPCFIIAGSGDAEAGRIRNHYRRNLPSSNTQIWKTGWAPPDTLNGKLAGGYKLVKMNSVEYQVNAQVYEFQGMSSHRSGRDTAIMTARMFDGGRRKGLIFIVHGELVRSYDLKNDLLKLMGNEWDNSIIPPKKYEEIKFEVT